MRSSQLMGCTERRSMAGRWTAGLEAAARLLLRFPQVHHVHSRVGGAKQILTKTSSTLRRVNSIRTKESSSSTYVMQLPRLTSIN